jgi:hypothetical protein
MRIPRGFTAHNSRRRAARIAPQYQPAMLVLVVSVGQSKRIADDFRTAGFRRRAARFLGRRCGAHLDVAGIGVSPDRLAEYGTRDETRREHLAKLLTTFGWRTFGVGEHREASTWLMKLARSTDQGFVLVRELMEVGEDRRECSWPRFQFMADGVGSGTVHAGLILKRKEPRQLNRGSGGADEQTY